MDSDDIYSAPAADLETDPRSAPEFFVVSQSKLAVLGIISFGLYYIFIAYKNWSYLNYKHQLGIWPVPRALFSFFFIHAFVRYLAAARDARGLPAATNLAAVATLYLTMYVTTLAIGIYSGATLTILPVSVQLGTSLLGLLVQVYVYQTLQSVINLVMDDVQGRANSGYGAGAILMILFGLLIWISNILGLLIPAPTPVQ